MKKSMLLFAACVALPLLVGCNNYFKIRDPVSDKVYYTDEYKNRGGGAIVFRDVVTHQEVRLANSEIMSITKDEYLANVHGR